MNSWAGAYHNQILKHASYFLIHTTHQATLTIHASEDSHPEFQVLHHLRVIIIAR